MSVEVFLFVLPDESLLPHLLPAALGIAPMSFVETAAAGKAFREADEPRPDANRELFALGLTNLLGGLLQNICLREAARRRRRLTAVVIDCTAIPDFEYTALKTLTEAEQGLQKTGIRLSLATLNPEPLQLIRKSKLEKTLGRQWMHLTSKRLCELFRLNRPIRSRGMQLHVFPTRHRRTRPSHEL
jgi:MFS superfamily sulfate permease-like transporter